MDLVDHLANCGVGAWAPLLAPGFEPRAVRFEVAEEFLTREHFTPGGEHGFHLLERRLFQGAPMGQSVLVQLGAHKRRARQGSAGR